MNEEITISNSEKETKHIASKLLEKFLSGLESSALVIFLSGDLGTGKTQYVKGLGESLGIEEVIISPSYVYIRNYKYTLGTLKGELVHIDAWRVDGKEGFNYKEIEDFLKPGNVLAIEWAGNIPGGIENANTSYELVEVDIIDKGGETREIKTQYLGE